MENPICISVLTTDLGIILKKNQRVIPHLKLGHNSLVFPTLCKSWKTMMQTCGHKQFDVNLRFDVQLMNNANQQQQCPTWCSYGFSSNVFNPRISNSWHGIHA
jgi:hypothetical protein